MVADNLLSVQDLW